MPYDYSTASNDPDLIPAGSIVTVTMHIRPGGVGKDELLKRSAKGDCEMLDIEYVIVDGDYARRKFWENQIVVGTTDGQRDIAKKYVTTRKQILQSARNIKEGDTSPRAREAYMADLKDFDNLSFIAEIGIEKGKPRSNGQGDFPDKNIIAKVITPDHAQWHPVTQAPPLDGAGGNGAAAPGSSPPGAPPSSTNPPIAPPDWAR
jgi:hypothetical protein